MLLAAVKIRKLAFARQSGAGILTMPCVFGVHVFVETATSLFVRSRPHAARQSRAPPEQRQDTDRAEWM